MPQLDKVTLFSQVFWLISTFIGFYVIVTKIFLWSIVSLLKIRLFYTIFTQEDTIKEKYTLGIFQNISFHVIEISSQIGKQYNLDVLVNRNKELTKASFLLKKTVALNLLKRCP